MNVMLDNDGYPFPTWIYKQTSPLYALYDCNSDSDDTSTDECQFINKSMLAPVNFTADEIAAINQSLMTHQRIPQNFITNDFINRLHVFNCYFDCIAIESVTKRDNIKWAIENDCLYLFKRLPGNKTKYLYYTIRFGSLNILKWFSDCHPELFTRNAMNEAADSGRLDIVKWLHYNRHEGCTTSAMDNAAANKHLDVIKWLHYNRREGCTTLAMDYAAAYGYLEIVKWLHYNRHEGCTVRAMDSAAFNCHLDVVKWLHNNRREGCTTNAIDYAAAYGYLEIIKWLHNNRSEGWTQHAMDNAEKKKYCAIVNYLNKHKHSV